LLLPLGISFYTFETVSYLIDVYRKRIEPSRSFLDYAHFLTFFPHLVAGPIVRAADFLPQCVKERKPSMDDFGWGFFLMLLGLTEKIIFADRILAPVADRIYSTSAAVSIGDAWLGTVAFAGQIFFDFAGYSTCGIGAALCLGFRLTRNFRFPYAAIGFSDFWRRWHISLSTWLRDYLYIPMGGNRDSCFAESRNLMVTMLLGGLWHGASWRFVIWGGLHGTFLLAERGVRSVFAGTRISSTLPARFIAAAVTFGLVVVTWAYFRAADLASANRIVLAMLGMTGERATILDPIHYLGTFVLVGAACWPHTGPCATPHWRKLPTDYPGLSLHLPTPLWPSRSF
jgi:alginate O-acetyltransferase complex protein AlgI